MDPELFLRHKRQDCDVYSLALLFVEIFTKSLPFVHGEYRACERKARSSYSTLFSIAGDDHLANRRRLEQLASEKYAALMNTQPSNGNTDKRPASAGGTYQPSNDAPSLDHARAQASRATCN